MNKLFFSKDLFLFSTEYTGFSSINGSTLFNVDGVKKPVPHCFVKLFNQENNNFISKAFSDINGKYSFDHINLKNFRYFLVVHHPDGLLNGVVADNIGGENVDN